jgi:hypothetical protein
MSVFFDWAESTRISRMSGLTDFDSSSEVFEIAQEFADDKVVVRLINKALAAGVRFAPDEVMALMLQIDKPTLTKLADTVSEPFSKEDLEELYMSIDDDVFQRICKRQNVDISTDEEDIDYVDRNEPAPKIAFFTKLLFAMGVAGGLSDHTKKHNGKCNGDCVHCPPRYGYRYGRWYYGHNHQHGCEFGRNKGL